jgi:hypothetical protein
MSSEIRVTVGGVVHAAQPGVSAGELLKLAADGSPLRYDWSAEAQKKATGAVDFAGGTAKC